jgi:hypothetical protein
MVIQDQNKSTSEVVSSAPSAATPLWPLLPKACGTGQAESFPSYMARLAAAHHISRFDLRELLDGLSERPKNQPVKIARGRLLDDDQTLVPVLIWATGRPELASFTLGSLPNALMCPSTLDVTRVRHCPECVRADQYPAAWTRILWEIDCGEACPVHNVLLASSACGSNSSRCAVHRVGFFPGVCRGCGAISFGCRPVALRAVAPDQCWIARKVGELIACATSGEQFASDSVFFGLESVLYAQWKTIANAERAMGLRAGRLSLALERGMRVNLRLLLLVCAHAGVEPISILRGNPVSCDPLVWGRVDFAKSRQTRRTRSQIEPELREILASNPDISVARLGRTLRVNAAMIDKMFPQEMQDLRVRRIERMQREKWL